MSRLNIVQLLKMPHRGINMNNFFEVCLNWFGRKAAVEETVAVSQEDTFIPHHGVIHEVYVELQIAHTWCKIPAVMNTSNKDRGWFLENIKLRMNNKMQFVGFSYYLDQKVELSTNIVNMLVSHPDRILNSNGHIWVRTSFKKDGLEKTLKRTQIFQNCSALNESIAMWNLHGIGECDTENLHVQR